MKIFTKKVRKSPPNRHWPSPKNPEEVTHTIEIECNRDIKNNLSYQNNLNYNFKINNIYISENIKITSYH